jgi:DNA-binding transcriptional MerR regulator
MKNQSAVQYSIGELAAKAEVSVRTLQYYDKKGLLKATFSDSGRRMYTRDDIFRLQQILFLKSFGFSLEEIKDKIFKFESASDLEEIFAEQQKILSGEIEKLNQITKMLDTVIFEIHIGKDVSIEKLVTIMYLMKQGNPYAFVLNYFGSEQLNSLAKRFESPDAKGKGQVFADNAKDVFENLRMLYQNGADPADADGQALAKRWWDMIMDFTEGDPEFLKTLVSAGMDIESWPDDMKDLQEAIGHFLGNALTIYLEGKNISLSETEKKHDD